MSVVHILNEKGKCLQIKQNPAHIWSIQVLYHKSFNPYQLYFNFQEYVYCNIFIITYILNHKSVDGIYN